MAGCLLFGLLSVAVPGQPAGAASGTVRLPTELDALAYAPNSETILFGSLGVETKLPGTVQDLEQVSVGLSSDGSISDVRVVQHLTVTGIGDFSFKVPGPARDVRVLPESASTPGLRKGALLWQGFSPGTKILAAEVDLFPGQEAERLPVAFSLRMAVDGRPLTRGVPASGAFRMTLEIRNNSAVPIRIADAPADPARLAPLLDTLRRLLASGRRAAPGRDGVPASVETTGPAATRQEAVEVPFVVHGEVVFPPGSLSLTDVGGAVARTDAQGLHVDFDAQVGGGAPQKAVVDIQGRATALGIPRLEMTGRPALPLAGPLRSPVGGSWARALALAPSRLDGRRMLALAMDVLWRVARLRQFDAYLGNPDVNGTSTSSYTFRLASPVRRVVTRAPGAPRAAPATIAAAVLIILLLVAATAVAWSYS
jgi:hypothetical protein